MTTYLTAQSTIKLASGYYMPRIGFGVYQISAASTQSLVTSAINAGYRHIDTAAAYRNEAPVVAAIHSSPVPRSEIFFTTKLAPRLRGYKATWDSIERCVTENPGLEGYIDLYLIHAPYGGRENRLEQWKAMRDAVERGWVRSLGVSNYSVKHLEELVEWIENEDASVGRKGAGGVISVGQWEFHPWLTRPDIHDFCKRYNIAAQAYSPLVRGTRFNTPPPKGSETLYALVEKYGRTPAQILLRWSLQMGFTPLPKTATEERIKENIDVFGWELTEEDMRELTTKEYSPCTWDPSGDCQD